MTDHVSPPVLPAAAAFILTRRALCAGLVVAMLTLVFWLPGILQGAPLLASLAAIVGVALHVLAPAVIATVTFGGGVVFAAQVSALASLAVSIIAGMKILPGLIVLTLYGLLPIWAASAMMRQDGVRKSAQYLAVGIGMATLAAIWIGGLVQDVGLREFVGRMLAPMFDATQAQISATDPAAVQALQQARKTTEIILPGIIALGFWLAWWGDIVLARSFALKYGFYQGHQEGLLDLRFGKGLAYAFLALLALANLGGGDVQFVAINAVILLGGLLAAQGVAVGHSWLKQKGMIFAIGLMYLMLLVWSVAVIPFVIIGLLDIWFDFRRITTATGG